MSASTRKMGLSTTTISESSVETWARQPTSLRDKVVKIDPETNRTEDLGIDGFASYGGDYPSFATEAEHFAAFLNSFDPGNTDPQYRAEVAKALADPSGDDYQYFANDNYFENTEFYPNGVTLQQRFTRFFAGQELNAFESQRELAVDTPTDSRRGNSKFPDSEDLNSNSTVDTRNSYFEYAIPLSRTILDQQAVPSEVNRFCSNRNHESIGREDRMVSDFEFRFAISRARSETFRTSVKSSLFGFGLQDTKCRSRFASQALNWSAASGKKRLIFPSTKTFQG